MTPTLFVVPGIYEGPAPFKPLIAKFRAAGTVRLWEAETGAHRSTLEGHTYGVRAVAFSPDGKHI